jgi:hypothetical protein
MMLELDQAFCYVVPLAPLQNRRSLQLKKLNWQQKFRWYIAAAKTVVPAKKVHAPSD